MIRLRTKIETFLVVLLLVSVVIYSVISVNRTITDTGDDFTALIRNSKGNYWNTSDAGNIQLAINDLNTTNGGIVWLPPGVFELDEGIKTYNRSISLIGSGWETGYGSSGHQLSVTELYPSVTFGNEYIIDCGEGSNGNGSRFVEIKNMVINGKQRTAPLGGIRFRAMQYGHIEAVWIDDFWRDTGSTYSVGINITGGDFTGATSAFNVIERFRIDNCVYGISLSDTANINIIRDGQLAIGWSNKPVRGLSLVDADSNVFSNINFEGINSSNGSCIYLGGTGGVTNNKFNDLRFEGNGRLVNITGGGGTGNNIFTACTASGDLTVYHDGMELVEDNGNRPSIFVNCRNFGSGLYEPEETYIRNSNGRYWDVTDNYIQEAIDDLNSSNGGTVYLPSGEITIDSTINVWSNVRIVGQGYSTLLFLNDTANVTMVQIQDEHNIEIEKIRLDGNEEGQETHAYPSVMWIRDEAENITIDNCWVYNSSGTSIYVGDYDSSTHCLNISNITIKNCFVKGKKDHFYGGGVFLAGQNLIVSDNYIADTWAVGVYLEDTHVVGGEYTNTSHDMIVTNNIITGNTSIGIGMEGQKSNRAIISNNFIHDLNSSAYAYESTPFWSRGILALNATVTGNYVYNVETAFRTDGCIVTGNHIKNMEQYGMHLSDNPSIGVKENIVTDNYIENTSGYGIFFDSGYPIISNNKLVNTGSVAIRRYDASVGSATINGNVIINCYGGIWGSGNDSYINYDIASGNTINNTESFSIFRVHTATNNLISFGGDEGIERCQHVSGNTIYNITGTGISCQYYQNNLITDNYIWNCTLDGIFTDNDNTTISNNMIFDCVSEGIMLSGVHNCTVFGNRIYNCNYGFREFGTCDFNIFVANNCLGTTNGNVLLGSNTVNSSNLPIV